MKLWSNARAAKPSNAMSWSIQIVHNRKPDLVADGKKICPFCERELLRCICEIGFGIYSLTIESIRDGRPAIKLAPDPSDAKQ
jgi:hypothetical protein